VQGVVGGAQLGLFLPPPPPLPAWPGSVRALSLGPHSPVERQRVAREREREEREGENQTDREREDHVSAGAAVTPCCPMRRAASRTAGRTVRLVALLLLLARAAGGSEFPERECCDPVYPLPAPPSSTTPYPSVPTATGRIGEYPCF
jgi:hypothetical protein